MFLVELTLKAAAAPVVEVEEGDTDPQSPARKRLNTSKSGTARLQMFASLSSHYNTGLITFICFILTVSTPLKLRDTLNDQLSKLSPFKNDQDQQDDEDMGCNVLEDMGCNVLVS